MVSEQRIEHGRPINTPDILFLDHVEINGQPVAWIDAKHFYGADVSFQRKKWLNKCHVISMNGVVERLSTVMDSARICLYQVV
ncbi:MAG: hypothetical protein CM15mP8_1690 [Methanobacteriota archaeon]|nr:MAG: hypothetical protein CM15mP8_1690 [Euryarchaeota archaeon]